MTEYRIKHGKFYPPRDSQDPVLRAGDIVTLTPARAKAYADMIELIEPLRPAPKPTPELPLKKATTSVAGSKS